MLSNETKKEILDFIQERKFFAIKLENVSWQELEDFLKLNKIKVTAIYGEYIAVWPNRTTSILSHVNHIDNVIIPKEEIIERFHPTKLMLCRTNFGNIRQVVGHISGKGFITDLGTYYSEATPLTMDEINKYFGNSELEKEDEK